MKVSVSFPLLNTFKPNAVIPLQSHTEVHGYQIWYTNSLDTKVHSNYKLATHIGFVIPIDGIKYALIPLIFPHFCQHCVCELQCKLFQCFYWHFSFKSWLLFVEVFKSKMSNLFISSTVFTDRSYPSMCN